MLAVRSVLQEGAGADEAVGPRQALQGLQGGERETETEGEREEVRTEEESNFFKSLMQSQHEEKNGSIAWIKGVTG